MKEQKTLYRCQKSGGGVGKKEGMDRSTLTSSFALVDKGNALCQVGTSRNSMLFKTLYELIRVYVKMYVHILPSYLEKYEIGKILKKIGKNQYLLNIL